RHQSIEEHFNFWDADKYAALTIHVIQTLQAELSIIKCELNLDDTDFVKFYNEEKLYLYCLKMKEPPIRDRLCIRYVEVLDDLDSCRDEWNTARSAANNALTTVGVGDFAEIRAALNTARIRVDAAYAKLQNAEALVAHMEIQLRIEEHWVIGGPEYIQFKEEATLGKYCMALNELEHLVVMRLFELSKLSLSGTGRYKLRQQIGKALQHRSEAIHNAINRYNTQAAALNPPRPKLSWKDIAEYSFLGEFDLLRHSCTDIRKLDWTNLLTVRPPQNISNCCVHEKKYLASMSKSVDCAPLSMMRAWRPTKLLRTFNCLIPSLHQNCSDNGEVAWPPTCFTSSISIRSRTSQVTQACGALEYIPI
ncbi:hypothetical protein EV702DRAFT_963120, partial [Suillus placidus]